MTLDTTSRAKNGLQLVNISVDMGKNFVQIKLLSPKKYQNRSNVCNLVGKENGNKDVMFKLCDKSVRDICYCTDVKFSLKFFIVMPCAFVFCVRNLFWAQARGERKWRVNLNCHSGNIMLFGKNKSIVWTCTLYEGHFYRDSKTHSALIFEFCMHLWTYHFQSVGQMSAFLTDLGVTYKGFHLESEHRHLNRVPPTMSSIRVNT